MDFFIWNRRKSVCGTSSPPLLCHMPLGKTLSFHMEAFLRCKPVPGTFCLIRTLCFYLEPFLGTIEALLRTLTRNLGISWNISSKPKPFAWNLGTFCILYLAPLLSTSEPSKTFAWNPYLEPRNLAPGKAYVVWQTPKLSTSLLGNDRPFTRSPWKASPTPEDSLEKDWVRTLRF